jgi:hypothetical protein
MKTLKINLNVLALLFGFAFAFSSFAFTNRSLSNSNSSTGWFATDRNGNLLTSPYVPIENPEISCLGGDDFCAKEYTLDANGNPETETQSQPVMRPVE